MTDSERITLKFAVQRAYEATKIGRPSGGSYYGERQRKFLSKQELLMEPTPGKCHWLSFCGFTDLGRKLYLNDDGTLREEWRPENCEGI